MIPEQALEAAAKAMHLDAYPADYWETRPDLRYKFTERARAALEAAAPHMLAEAWDEGYTLGYADCANKQESSRPNPYMLNNEGEK